MLGLRLATLADFAAVIERTRALNAIESLVLDEATLEFALRKLLADSSLGSVWLVEREHRVIGHAVVTYGYDLEFGGRDSYLTEFFVDESERDRGAGSAALELLAQELRERDVRALHLGVRPDNRARRLYERAGFEHSPRIFMTRRLG